MSLKESEDAKNCPYNVETVSASLNGFGGAAIISVVSVGLVRLLQLFSGELV